MQVATSD